METSGVRLEIAKAFKLRKHQIQSLRIEPKDRRFACVAFRYQPVSANEKIEILRMLKEHLVLYTEFQNIANEYFAFAYVKEIVLGTQSNI